jgi:hypothetical protein
LPQVATSPHLGSDAIYGLFLFFAQHRTLISALLCAGAVLAAVSMLRARRPVGAIGVIIAAGVLTFANSQVSSDLVNALVYERGPIGPEPGEQACAALAQGVLRASAAGAGQSGPDQRPEYAGAVQAYLAGGCGGEGRDLRALRQAVIPGDGARF